MRVRYTPQALADIDEIYRRIASANPDAAQRVEDRIRSTIERVGQFPRTGVRTSLEHVRRVPLVRWPYTIFYRIAVADDVVDILRIVHGARVKDRDVMPQ